MNILLTLSGLFAILFSAESYFRFIDDTSNSYGLSKGARRWLTNHYQLNNLGFRDSVPYTLKKDTPKTRISIVGDSFTAGHGINNVEDRFSNQLRKLHPETEILVFADNGLDTGAEITLLEDLFKGGLQTDYVLLVYCLNDISDLSLEWEKTLKRLYEKQNVSFWGNASFLINYLQFKWLQNHVPEVANYYQITQEQYQGKDWQIQKDRLSKINKVIKSHDAKLIVVTLPYFHLLQEKYPYKNVHLELRQFWKQLDVPHLDLLEAFSSYSAKEMVVNPNDAHPNEQAHRIIARNLNTFIP